MNLTRRTLVAGSAIAAILLSACGGENSSTSSSTSTANASASATTKITVAVVPVADVMPIYLGITQGIFEKHGLQVEVVQAQGAAAAVPLLLNGEVQFAYGAFQPVITAVSQDVPLTIVSGGISRALSPEQDIAAVVVKPESTLAGLTDLQGHTLAINALRAGPEYSMRIGLEKAGADPNKVEFVEVPMPETIESLQQGRIDAAYVPEPFRTQAIEAGLKVIASPIFDSVPAGSTSAYFSAKPYVAQNSAVVDAFRAAITEASAYTQDNPEAARAELVSVAKIDPAIAAKINLPNYDPTLNREALQDAVDNLVKLGWIEKAPSLDDLVAP